MALNELYFISAPLNQYFVDKDTGLPLSGGTLTFFRDKDRTTLTGLKDVYELTGADPNYDYTALPNPLTLSTAGTVVNNSSANVALYLRPFTASGELDLYYVVCRNSDGVEQWTRQAWPNITAANDPTSDDYPIQNQIANPQFSRDFLNNDFDTVFSVTAAAAEEYPIAPDWDLVITGTGSVTVRRNAIAGNDNVITSPPFVMDITVSAGVTQCLLRQRFNKNSGIWTSTDTKDIYLSTTILARNELAGSQTVQMFYTESTPAAGMPIEILTGSAVAGSYTLLKGSSATPIPASGNTNTGENAYAEVYISLAEGVRLRLSSIQVVPTLSTAGQNFLDYDSNSSNREQALMGDYYIPALERRTAKSMLQCWDFPKNPEQFTLASFTNVPNYLIDQTLVQNGTANAITYARYQANGINCLQFTTDNFADETFLMCQYLEGADIKPLLEGRMSVNVNAWADRADVGCRVYLYRGSNAAAFPIPSGIVEPAAPVANQYMLGSITTTAGANLGVYALADADPQRGQNWAEIGRNGLGNPHFLLQTMAAPAELATYKHDYGYSQYEITDTAELNDTDKFAIIVTFACPTAITNVYVNSISLAPGDIATRPEPQSAQEVISDAQKYFETSLDAGLTWSGALVRQNSGWTIGYSAGTSSVVGGLALLNPAKYNTEKRATPSRKIKPIEAGADGQVSNMGAMNFPGANETLGALLYEESTSATTHFGTPAGTGWVGGTRIAFRWYADARIGKV
jgi:hypothetical protein